MKLSIKGLPIKKAPKETVIIHIKNGIASCRKCPKGINVQIFNFDTENDTTEARSLRHYANALQAPKENSVILNVRNGFVYVDHKAPGLIVKIKDKNR